MGERIDKIITETKAWYCRITEGKEPSLDPQVILKKIESNRGIQALKRGEIVIEHDELEFYSEKESSALKIIQGGLVTLGILKINTKEPCWWRELGIYREKTRKAVDELQSLAGIPDGKKGMRFGLKSIKALEIALQAKAEGKDWRKAVESQRDKIRKITPEES